MLTVKNVLAESILYCIDFICIRPACLMYLDLSIFKLYSRSLSDISCMID